MSRRATRARLLVAGRAAARLMGAWFLVVFAVFALVQLAGVPLAAEPDEGRSGIKLGAVERSKLREELRTDLALLFDPSPPPREAESGLERILLRSWTETRFAHWFSRVLRLDFGVSLYSEERVGDLLRRRAVPTLLLQSLALLLAVLVGAGVGLWSGLRAGAPGERRLQGVLLLLYATPSFVLGSLLVEAVGPSWPTWGLLPPRLMEGVARGERSAFEGEVILAALQRLLLPVLILAVGEAVLIARHVRGAVADALRSPAHDAALLSGLPLRRVRRDLVLRPGLLPLAPLLGQMIPGLIAGSIVVETLFSLPGLGKTALEAALRQDVPVLMGVVTLSALLSVVGWWAAEGALRRLDRRVGAR